MLIDSPRLSAADREHWRKMERIDAMISESSRIDRLTTSAVEAIEAFVEAGPCYAGISWGKDSVVVAHLIILSGVDVPLIWFPAGEIENPDCVLVRDAFLTRFPSVRYIEHPATLSSDDWDRMEGHDGAQAEFERASRAYGRRYISGVRAEESGLRKRAMRQHGLVARNTCRPIGWWTGADVFAYLHKHGLPVHPVYAMTLAGAYDRIKMRVGTIGGYRGVRFGRRMLEEHYYPDRLPKR